MVKVKTYTEFKKKIKPLIKPGERATLVSIKTRFKGTPPKLIKEYIAKLKKDKILVKKSPRKYLWKGKKKNAGATPKPKSKKGKPKVDKELKLFIKRAKELGIKITLKQMREIVEE